MNDIDNTFDKWEALVGKFLLSFSKIEWFTYYLLTRLPSEDIFNTVKSLGLRKRIELIQDLIVARDIPKETIDSMTIFFDKTKDISEIRNTIAHNPLHLDVFNAENEYTSRFQISKYSHRIKPNKIIKIKELEKYCEDAEILSSKCPEYLDIIDKCIFEQNRITSRPT